jgi:septum formation protein
MERLPLILASNSPRRKELLAEWGYTFSVIPPSEEAETGPRPGEQPAALVTRLAQAKAADVARRVKRGIILGCDTVAECQGRILGKPAGRAEARRMLGLLRGQEHRVYSGLCLWRRPEDDVRTELDVTTLVMDPLPDEQLEEYLDTGAWQGKAGAFGYQDGLDWVHVLEGSESNVVGLPMELLRRMLGEMGVDE